MLSLCFTGVLANKTAIYSIQHINLGTQVSQVPEFDMSQTYTSRFVHVQILMVLMIYYRLNRYKPAHLRLDVLQGVVLCF